MNYLYRMTHIDNLPHILRYGITHCASANANQNYVPIGNLSLISGRNSRFIETVCGTEYMLGDFIPFYFYARMPMLFNIQNGFGVPKLEPDNIIYLIVRIDSITADPAREYFFSDHHAMCKRAKFYGKEHIGQIDELLDKEAILNNNWGDDYTIKERKQAEFLIKGDIPADLITRLVCYNESVKLTLTRMLEDANMAIPLTVNPEAYY